MDQTIDGLASLTEQLHQVPTSSGCYLFYNHLNQIIYVGKAKNLRQRLKNYWQKSTNERTTRLVAAIKRFEIIPTLNEKSSLILEHNLIKEHHPRFNILLKDGKRYPYILVTKDLNPSYVYTRHPSSKAAICYGPLPEGTKALQIFRILQSLIPLWRCRKKTGEPCFFYRIGQCSGACFKNVPSAYYTAQIKKIKAFFQGKNKTVAADLTKKMKIAADQLQFETAAKIQQLINSLEFALSSQNVARLHVADVDVINYFYDQQTLVITILFYRGGALLNQQNKVFFKVANFEDINYLVRLYLQSIYKVNVFPQALICPSDLKLQELKLIWSDAVRYARTLIEQQLLATAGESSFHTFQQKQHAAKIDHLQQLPELMQQLKVTLNLKDYPFQIEIFDISNWGSDLIVAACAVFQNGLLINKLNRVFVLPQTKSDDYYSMRLALIKKYQKLQASKRSQPNLIIVDGGIQHINTALIALKTIALSIPIAGLVKNNRHTTDRLINQQGVTVLDLNTKTSQELFFWLMNAQITVHNLAIRYLQKKRTQAMRVNLLTTITGISERRAQLLYQHFRTLQAMAQQSFEDLNAVLKNKTVTTALQTWLKNYVTDF